MIKSAIKGAEIPFRNIIIHAIRVFLSKLILEQPFKIKIIDLIN